MATRRIYDDERDAQFVTFSCYRRRRLLDHARARQIVIGILAEELAKHRGVCGGFVVMPNHVHAIVWFQESNQLSQFMQIWKSRSAREIKLFLRGHLEGYFSNISPRDAFWQAKYYAFNLFTDEKAMEKLEYMHLNPVRAGLAERAIDWKWSSARFFELQEPVGAPLEWVFTE